MRRPVQSAHGTETVVAAARKMREANVGFLPVCDGGGHIVGVLTDRDIAIRVCAEADVPSETTVESVMTADVVACRPRDELRRAEELMVQTHKSRVVVSDEDGKVVGVISLSDVATHEERGAARVLRAVAEREVLEQHGSKARGDR
jgi:CBS domain-containing protein